MGRVGAKLLILHQRQLWVGIEGLGDPPGGILPARQFQGLPSFARPSGLPPLSHQHRQDPRPQHSNHFIRTRWVGCHISVVAVCGACLSAKRLQFSHAPCSLLPLTNSTLIGLLTQHQVKRTHPAIDNDVNAVDPVRLLRHQKSDCGRHFLWLTSTLTFRKVGRHLRAKGFDKIIKNARANSRWTDSDKPVASDIFSHLFLMPVDDGLFG